MKSVEIEVLRPKAALQAFKHAWRQTKRGEAVMPRLAFGSWAEVFSAITEKRVELIGYVIGHEQINTRQLAQALGRDYKNVYTDVQALVQIGLLDKDSRGRISAPYDEIVIRAELRDVPSEEEDARLPAPKQRNPRQTMLGNAYPAFQANPLLAGQALPRPKTD